MAHGPIGDGFATNSVAQMKDRLITAEEPAVQIDFASLLQMCWHRKWTILLSALFFGTIAAYYAFFVAQPRYTSLARLTLEFSGNQIVDFESVVGGISKDAAEINTQLEVLRSERLVREVVKELDLLSDPAFNTALTDDGPSFVERQINGLRAVVGLAVEEETPTEDDILNAVTVNVRDMIEVSSPRTTYIMRISVTSGSAEKSGLIANALAQAYIDDQVDAKFTATEYAVSWLTARVTELERDILAREEELRDLRQVTGLTSVEALEVLEVRFRTMREQLVRSNVAMEEAQQRIDVLQTLRDRSDPLAAAAEIEGGEIITGFFPEDADVQTVQRRIDRLLLTENTNLARERERGSALTETLEKMQLDVNTQNQNFQKAQNLTRELEATQILYQTFLARLKETTAQIGLQSADTRVLTVAKAGQQVAPRKKALVLVGLLFGGFLGLGWAIFERMRQSQKVGLDLSEKLPEVPVFGQIPLVPKRKRRHVIQYFTHRPESRAAEAIRNLRTMITMAASDVAPQVIMLTSSTPAEGKTTVSFALACNFVGLNKRVLLVDVDLRRATLAQYFDEVPEKGLSNVLEGELTLENAVVELPDFGIDALFCGETRKNPADLLASPKMRELLQEMRSRYDVIIIDTPPVLVVPDAKVIGQFADRVLYIARWNHTALSNVQVGLDALSAVGIRTSGLILSQVDLRKVLRYSYGGYGYGSRYGYGAYREYYQD
ncbi:MAG: polysaccharide biosynthesis tyrosine autokinase [Pseudomonadota bacterium]